MPMNKSKKSDLPVLSDNVNTISVSGYGSSSSSSSIGFGASSENKEIPFNFLESDTKVPIANDSLIIRLDLESIPDSFRILCDQLNIDLAILVKHLVLKSYRQILDDATNDPLNLKELAKDLVKTQYIIGKITSDVLENAVKYDWLSTEDIDNINKSKQRYVDLFIGEGDK